MWGKTKTTMAQAVMEKLQVLRYENHELKQNLAKQNDLYTELKNESNFNKAKAEELNELLETKGADQVMQKLLDKSLKNAEISSELDKLKMQLESANNCVNNLGQERDGHKRMLLQLSDIVRTLQSVTIDYKTLDASDTYIQGQDVPLKNVKRKVEAIVEDRKLLVSKCEALEKTNRQKDEKIAALEAQFHLLNSINTCIGLSGEDREAISSSLKHSSPEEPEATLMTCASFQRGTGIERTPSQDTPGYEDGNGYFHKKKPWNDDMSVFSGGTAPQSFDEESRYETNPASETSCVSSIQVNNLSTFDDSEEVESLRTQLEQANERYYQFKQVCQSAFANMSNVKQELEESKRALHSAETKRDDYKENLRDVINQYKELHDESDEAVSKMLSMESHIKNFEEERAKDMQRAAELLAENGGMADNVDDLINAYQRAGERIANLERKLAAAEREAEAAGQRKEIGDRKLRDAIAKHQKMEQMQSCMQAQVSNAQEQMRLVKKEAQKHKEEAKHTRRRLTSFLKKVDKLAADKDHAYETIMELKATKQKVLNDIPWSSDVLHRMMITEATVVGKAWQERRMLQKNSQQLANENEELKAFCEEVLNEVGRPVARQ